MLRFTPSLPENCYPYVFLQISFLTTLWWTSSSSAFLSFYCSFFLIFFLSLIPSFLLAFFLFLSFSFSLSCSTFQRNLHWFLLAGIKCDRRETFTIRMQNGLNSCSSSFPKSWRPAITKLFFDGNRHERPFLIGWRICLHSLLSLVRLPCQFRRHKSAPRFSAMQTATKNWRRNLSSNVWRRMYGADFWSVCRGLYKP